MLYITYFVLEMVLPSVAGMVLTALDAHHQLADRSKIVVPLHRPTAGGLV
jgi:hypothetical protein